MITSQVKYIKTINEINNENFDIATDYVLPGVFPIDFSTMQGLLNIEIKDSTLLENAYIEFDSLELSGRQILNLCNNLNTNILIKNVTDEQMESMLQNYTKMDMRKTVYPTKIVILITLYLLYLKHFKGYDIFEKFEDNIKYIYDTFISYTYIQDKYSMDFISKWVQWFLMHLIENEKEFITNFKQHCLYLFETAYSYHKKIEVKNDDITTSSIRSGLAVPLAYVMRDLKFNVYKINFLSVPKVSYDYLSNMFKADVIKALSSVVDYTIAAEQYITAETKEEVLIEDLSTLTEKDVIEALKDKKCFVTSKPHSNLDLFPLEIKISE